MIFKSNLYKSHTFQVVFFEHLKSFIFEHFLLIFELYIFGFQLVMASNCRIVTSNKNGLILEDGEYRYHFHSFSKNRNNRYWRCELRDICGARCTTNADVVENGVTSIKYSKTRHMHEAEKVEIAVQEVIRNIKRKASEHPNAPPAAILREEIVNVTNEAVIHNLPERRHVLRNINRMQNRHRPQRPMVLGDLEVISPYSETLTG